MKPLFSRSDLPIVQLLSELAYCNPFIPRRIELERELLGDAFDVADASWNRIGDTSTIAGNVVRVVQLATRLVDDARARLASGSCKPPVPVLDVYRDAVLLVLYYRHAHSFLETIMESAGDEKSGRHFGFFRKFQAEFDGYFCCDQLRAPHELDAAHYFACFFQIRRAFYQIFQFMQGSSMPAATLRAQVWESVFTSNMRRYQRSLTHRMGSQTTLVTGPSGTGKELVARAIGLARFIPFQARELKFEAHFLTGFHAVNLSAFSPTLIESELFGHRRGAFTGAVQDRIGWFERCGAFDTVFLDEIGEVDHSIQVKLLRVLEAREFQRLGESETLPFPGRIIAATNRDLEVAMRDGEFRRDFYFRLCGDVIHMPSLHERFADCADELPMLARFLSRRIVGEDEADLLAGEVVDWVTHKLGPNYPWPGNVREFEQCVRNILIRSAYHPVASSAESGNDESAWLEQVKLGKLTVERLLETYCRRVYQNCRSYEETGRQLAIDRRTVKKYVDSVG